MMIGTRLSSALMPFRVRNYRCQWPSDLLTSWGFEMELLILAWFVLTQTNSVLWMTAISSMPFVGTLLAPLIGTLGDRIGLRNLMCLMRATYAVLALTMLAGAHMGWLTVPLAFAIAAASGLVKPSDIGVRSALVAETVSPGILTSAMGLSRTTSDSARIIGALTGAGLFAAFGFVTAYVLVAVCYLLAFFFTWMIGQPDAAAPPESPEQVQVLPVASPWRDLVEGFRYVWRTPHILAGMWLAFLVNLTAFPLSNGLLPYVARDVLGADQTVLGHLLASFAFGALCGSLLLTFGGFGMRPARLMIYSTVSWYLCLLLFVSQRTETFCMLALFGAGLSQSLSMISLVLLLVQTSERRLRGRVMGVRMLAIYSLPIGLVAAGWLIPRFGYPAVATGYAASGLVLTVVIWLVWRRCLWQVQPSA